MRDAVLKQLGQFWIDLYDSLPNLVSGFIYIFLLILVLSVVNWITRKKLLLHLQDQLLSTFLSQFIKWTLIIIGAIASLYIIGFGNAANKFVAGAGISAIIIGFAFKDIGENFLAGIMLAFSRPFSIRDSVECAGMKGLVIKLTLRYTHIRSQDGRDIYMPNAMIVKNPLINYTRDGLIRLDFIVDICDEENISKAQQLIVECLKAQEWILDDPSASVVIESMADQHIQLKVMFWINTFKTKREADLLKSEVMHLSRNILRTNGFRLSSKN